MPLKKLTFTGCLRGGKALMKVDCPYCRKPHWLRPRPPKTEGRTLFLLDDCGGLYTLPCGSRVELVQMSEVPPASCRHSRDKSAAARQRGELLIANYKI